MRLSTLLLPIALCCGTPLTAGVTIERLLTDYMPASAFARVSEFFTGKENTRGATLLRTQPASRDGFYFNLRTAATATIDAARVELQIITPTSPDVRTESFAVQLPKGSHLIRLGLTGKDWPDPGARPVAWKIRLIAPDGAELASKASYLWAKPTAPRDS